MSIGLFVWTFDGVMKAIALGIILLAALVFGLLLAVASAMDWWDKRRRKKPNTGGVGPGPTTGTGTHDELVGGAS